MSENAKKKLKKDFKEALDFRGVDLLHMEFFKTWREKRREKHND